MTDKIRRFFAFQRSFPSFSSEQPIVTKDIDQIPLGRLYHQILSKDMLWNLVFMGQGVIVDPQLGLILSFEQNRKVPENWRKKHEYTEEDFKQTDGISAIILHISPFEWYAYENLKMYIASLERHLKRHMGGLFIFEDTGNDSEVYWREQILEEIGLVERNVKVGHDIITWSGRSPKNPVHNRTDALRVKTNHTYWQAEFRRNLPSQIPIPLEELGCKVISIDAMMQRLHNSGFPLDDFSRAKQGFGTAYEGPCGICLGLIDKGGLWFNTVDCINDTCPTSVHNSQNVERVHTIFFINVPFSNGSSCPDCFHEYQFTYQVAAKNRDQITQLRCDSQCACGHIEGGHFSVQKGDKVFFK